MRNAFTLTMIMMMCACAAACDLFIREGGSDFDNVAMCQDVEDSLNALECMVIPFDLDCESYAEEDCDQTAYWECWADAYYCDGGLLTADDAQMDECTTIADEADCAF